MEFNLRKMITILSLILLLGFEKELFSQEKYSYEYFYGINDRARSDVPKVDSILNVSPSQLFGIQISRYFPAKKLSISLSFGLVKHREKFTNLKYELSNPNRFLDFQYNYIATFPFIKIGAFHVKELKKIKNNKSSILLTFGGGLMANPIDFMYRMSTFDASLGRNKDFWSFDTGPNTSFVVYPLLGSSLRLHKIIYDRLFVSVRINYEVAPFNKVRAEYKLEARDGTIEGLFYQRMHNLNLGVGIGITKKESENSSRF